MFRHWVAALVVALCGLAPVEAQVLVPDLAGLGWGVGIAFVDDLDEDRVSAASVDGQGILRVDRRENASVRIVLEGHYLFPLRSVVVERPTGPERVATVGVGPFAALLPGDPLFNAAGGGVLFGFRRPGAPYAFNLGVGVMVDMAAQFLGAEFVDGQPAPSREIRFVTREAAGLLVVTSFAF